MFYALSWFAVLGLLALWSLAAWAFHSMATWAVANAAVLAGGSEPTAAMRVPDWLAPLIPPEIALAFTSMLASFKPFIEALLDAMPTLAGGLSAAVWVVWAVGCALLIGTGIVLSGAIALLRRRSPASTRQAAA